VQSLLDIYGEEAAWSSTAALIADVTTSWLSRFRSRPVGSGSLRPQ
jgi:hypothetical protein